MTALPWHAALQRSVGERLAAGRLPHALLIVGPEGWGETALANWLALTLLGLPTNREAAALAHPDLRWLAPDGAVIKVDSIRDVVTFTQGTPQAGPRKVAVIADAHALNVSAANALLKTLEEPPAGTHLVLTSSHPARLLPTIRSRCQDLIIQPDPALARSWLSDQLDGADVDVPLFEHGGAPVAVLEAVRRGETPLQPLLEHALRGHGGGEVVQQLLEPGLAGVLARWYRYVLALAAAEWRLAQLAQVPPRALMAFADELIWARRQLLTSNSANERLVAERVVARWCQLPRAR
ncbi:MAG: hypothetical protein RIC56_22315 [Pseudomonadales bacterium]